MRVGDLVQYTRDWPTSYAEFELGLKAKDIGLIIDTLRNGRTVKVWWIRADQKTWMGKQHLEVLNGRQKTKSNCLH